MPPQREVEIERATQQGIRQRKQQRVAGGKESKILVGKESTSKRREIR